MKTEIKTETTEFFEQCLAEALTKVEKENPPAIIVIPRTNGMKLVLKETPEAKERKLHDVVKEVTHNGHIYLICNA